MFSYSGVYMYVWVDTICVQKILICTRKNIKQSTFYLPLLPPQVQCVCVCISAYSCMYMYVWVDIICICMCGWIQYVYVCVGGYNMCAEDMNMCEVQPVVFKVSCNLNLQAQSHWSLFNGTWQKRRIELDHRLEFEI